MRSGVLGLVCGFALVGPFFGCVGGQTGSPSCAPPGHCVCDPLFNDGTLLRVHVERFEPGKLEAVVDEVFAPSDSSPQAQVADRVGGLLLAQRPCGSDAHAEPEVGSELLVLYRAGQTLDYPNCSAFQSCAASECAGLSEPAVTECWTACTSRSQEFCGQQRNVALLAGTFSYAVPWADTLSFGGSKELASHELSVLFTHESCVAQFPADPAPPCDDTNEVFACAAAPPAAQGRKISVLFALIGLLLLGRHGARRGLRG